jgi:hypothetical protein
MRQKVEDFISSHSRTNYCEAIVYKDGTIKYAEPCHIDALIRVTGEDKDIINEKMPTTAAPIYWLINYTGCIAVWTNFFISGENMTREQAHTIDELIKHKLTKL